MDIEERARKIADGVRNDFNTDPPTSRRTLTLATAAELPYQDRFYKMLRDCGITTKGAPTAAFLITLLDEAFSTTHGQNSPWELRDMIQRLSSSVASEIAIRNSREKPKRRSRSSK